MKTFHKAMVFCSFDHYQLEVPIGCFSSEDAATGAVERTKMVVDLNDVEPRIKLMRDGQEYFVAADELQLQILRAEAQARLGPALDVSHAEQREKAVEALSSFDSAYVVTEADFEAANSHIRDFLRGCGDNCRLHSSSYRVTFGSTASDEELEDVDCFDPNIVASINCYLLEPSHDAIRDHVVVGDGPRLPEDCGPALLPVLARLPVQWKHETSAISDFQGYGHQRVMGWSAEIGVEEFVRLVEPLRPVNDDDLEEWLDQLALYLNPTVVKVICRKKTWTAIDHLKGDYQARAGKWASACFGEEAAINHFHRRSRFIEEAIELHQAAGGTADEIIQLVKHVYNKPTGDPHQEVGGTMVTLATLCNALGVDLLHAGEDELARVWEEFPRIRAKQAAAKEGSPLPGKVDV